jgi:hypothetical protein
MVLRVAHARRGPRYEERDAATEAEVHAALAPAYEVLGIDDVDSRVATYGLPFLLLEGQLTTVPQLGHKVRVWAGRWQRARTRAESACRCG